MSQVIFGDFSIEEGLEFSTNSNVQVL